MIISPDSYLYNSNGKYIWTQARVISAWAQAYAALKAALATKKYSTVVLMIGSPGSGKSTWLHYNEKPNCIYFDATFVSAKSRKPVIRMAQQYNTPVEAVVMQTSIEVCKQRNALREPDRRVPDQTLCLMAQKMIAGRPRESEGFSKITFVNSDREI